MKVMISGTMPSGQCVVWNSRLLDARRGLHAQRGTWSVEFDAGPGNGELSLPPSLVETHFQHHVMAQSADAHYRLVEVRDDHLVVTQQLPRTRPVWKLARPVADFDRIYRRRQHEGRWHEHVHVTELGLSTTQAPDPAEIVDEITKALLAAAPAQWQEIRIRCDSITSRQDLSATVVTADGQKHHWLPPMMVDQWFHRLRITTSGYPHGAWYRADYVLRQGELPSLAFDFQAEPDWRSYRETREEFARLDFESDVMQFPRHRDLMPDWYAGLLTELRRQPLPEQLFAEEPVRHPDVRLVRVFDGTDENGKPLGYRAPVIPAEKAALLDYLNGGHAVLTGRGLAPDLLTNGQPEKVPMIYQTDGEWVWSGAVAYYLEHHDHAPPQEFLAHIRGEGYQLPERLPSMTKARALAAATDAADKAPGFDGEWELAMRWLDSSVRQFQIDPNRFSVGSDREQALCLTRKDDRWAVYWLYQGERQMYAEFDTPLQAVTYFSGYLAMFGQGMRQQPPAQQ